MKPDPQTTKFACVSVLEYDNGDLSCVLLGKGEQKECFKLMNTIPAVATSDNRPIKDSRIVVMPWDNWEELQNAA